MNRRTNESVVDHIEECNRLAMNQITNENYSHALGYLNQALTQITQMPESKKRNHLTALTFNNLGCFFKRLGQPDQALDYFFKSLELENEESESIEVVSNTYINISVLLSLKSEHERALRYSIKALMLLKSEFKKNPQLIISIINCYSRIGIEYKALGQFSQAMQCFKKGFEICSKLKPSASVGLKQNFRRMYIECLSEIGEKNIEFNAPKTSSKGRIRKFSYSPKSTLDSYTTSNTNYQPINLTHRTAKGELKNRRKSLALPPMEDFNCGKKGYLGKVCEFEEKKKRINADKHRVQERVAATLIQAYWRGFLQRKRYFSLLLNRKIEEAEEKARKATEEIKQLKTIAQNQRIFKITKKK